MGSTIETALQSLEVPARVFSTNQLPSGMFNANRAERLTKDEIVVMQLKIETELKQLNPVERRDFLIRLQQVSDPPASHVEHFMSALRLISNMGFADEGKQAASVQARALLAFLKDRTLQADLEASDYLMQKIRADAGRIAEPGAQPSGPAKAFKKLP